MNLVTYEYVALDAAGAKQRGEVVAASEVEAYRRAASRGLTMLRIRRARLSRRGKGRIRPSEVAHFTFQLSVLVGARIPIADGVRSIAEQEPNAAFRRVVNAIADHIEAGGTISKALEAHQKFFGDVYVQTIHAAEQSGTMTRVLEYLAEMIDRQAETVRQVRGALLYPACIVTTLALATLFLLVGIVPRFASMFAERGVELPMLTKVMAAVSTSLRSGWWAYAGAGAGLVVGTKLAWNRPKARLALDGALERVPVLRSILQGMGVARFSRVLGVCLGAGVGPGAGWGLLDALTMAGKASGRPRILADAQTMIAQVHAGGRISQVLSRCPSLPPFARRMLAAGEESAELTRMCEIVARQYERETSHLTKNLATLIEPVLVVAIAGVVLVIALSIFLPMWNMVELVR
jgi:type II secretory pathway component PulF